MTRTAGELYSVKAYVTGSNVSAIFGKYSLLPLCVLLYQSLLKDINIKLKVSRYQYRNVNLCKTCNVTLQSVYIIFAL